MRRVAIIGAGGMAGSHAACYAKIENAEIVAVMDVVPNAAQALAEKYDVPAFTDAAEMFEKVEFDVVDVCTPTPFHTPYIKMAAAAGKDICSEKPLGRTMEQCWESIEACKKAGVRLFVAQVLRWFPEFRRANELVRSGAVGKPAVVRTTRGGGFPKPPSNWFADFEQSGGVVLDLLIHDIDWVLWTFGPAERVYASGLTFAGVEDRDYALLNIRFKSGMIAHIEGSWATPDAFRVAFEVAGDEGFIEYSNEKSSPLIFSSWASDDLPGRVPVPVPSSPMSVSPYYLELKHFIDCLEMGCEPDVKPEEAAAAVQLALAAVESIRTGQPVNLA